MVFQYDLKERTTLMVDIPKVDAFSLGGADYEP